MIWSIDQGLNQVSDNREMLSRTGHINFATMDVIYNHVDSQTFTFQINGNADARNDYQALAVSTFERTGKERQKRSGPSSPPTCKRPTTSVIINAGAAIPIISRVLRDIYRRLTENQNGIRRIRPNDPTNPIQESVVRRIPTGRPGQSHTERVEFVSATITPLHYRRNERTNFPNSGNTSLTYMRENLNGLEHDERGHTVASMFSGPPHFYNMFPQQRGLNRNFQAVHLLTDWYETELRMREHLEDNRGTVRWEIALSYANENTGRPHAVNYAAIFYDHHNIEINRIEGRLRNCEGSMILPDGRNCGF